MYLNIKTMNYERYQYTPFTGENIVLLMVTIIPVTGIYIPICFDTMFADVNNSSSSSLKQLFELIIHT